MSYFDSDTIILMNFDAATTHSPTGHYNRTWKQGADILRIDSRNTATTRGADYADYKLGSCSAYWYGSANQYLHITEPLTPVKDITISFQVKLFKADTDNPILFQIASTADAMNDDTDSEVVLKFFVDDEGHLIFHREGNVLVAKNTTVDFFDGTWHAVHLYINSSGKFSFSVDSALKTTTTYSPGALSTSMYIGFNRVGHRWNGYLDNFRIQKGVDTSYPIFPLEENIPYPNVGTVQKNQTLSNSQLSSMADGGQNFSWNSSGPYLMSGAKCYMVAGYNCQSHFKCKPKTKLNMQVTYSISSVTNQYAKIKVAYTNSSGTEVENTVVNKYGLYSMETASYTLQKNTEYEIKFQFQIATNAAPTATSASYSDYTNTVASREQRFKIHKVEFLQAFEPVDISYVEDEQSFDLEEIADGDHFAYDSANSRLQSGENSYHVASGYSKACIRFMPTSTGHLTIRYGISSQSSLDVGAIYIQEAGQEDSEGNMTWYNFFEPTLTQAINGQVPSNSYNLRHVVHTSGTVTEATVDVPVEAGVYYALGLHYVKNAAGDTGDDRFYIYEISMHKETSEFQYMSYVLNGKHNSIPLGLTGSTQRLNFVNEGEIYTTNALAAGNSKASPLHLPYQSQDYTGEKDFKTIVALPSMLESEFEYEEGVTRTVRYEYDSSHILATGTKSAINAGMYQLIFILKDKENYRWSSGGTENKMSGYTWRIKKAKTTLSYPDTEITVDKDHFVTKSLTKSHASADFSVISENTKIATITRYSASSSVFSVTGVDVGTTRVKLQILGTDNFEESNVITLTVNVVPKIWRWNEIQTMLDNNTLENTFPVGSRIVFPMDTFKLAGAGSNEYEISESQNYYLEVLGYNHNKDREIGTHSVSLQIMSTADDNDHSVALYKAAMNTTQTREEWINTNMRNTNMARIKTAIGSQKYSGSKYSTSISTASLDKTRIFTIKYQATNTENHSAETYERVVESIYIPAFHEIYETTFYHDGETAYTQTFDYYKAGGSLLRTYYNGSDQLGDTAAQYYTRSVLSGSDMFKVTTTGRIKITDTTNNSAEIGITPIFNLCGNPFWCLSWEQVRYLAENDMLTQVCTSTSTVYTKYFTISEGPFAGDYAAVLIGINHNQALEGHGTAHFEIRRTNEPYGTGNRIAFFDSSVGTVGESGTYRHKASEDITGGWRSSELRDRLREFYEYLPEDLKENIIPCPKYTDNVGEQTNTASNISCSSDELWIMSEIECGITGGYSNSNMSSYCQRYSQYGGAYSTAANRVKRRWTYAASTAISDQTMTWLRDPSKSSSTFCLTERTGNASTMAPNMSYAIAPCFAVGGSKYAIIEHNGSKTEIPWSDLRDQIVAGTHSLQLGDIVWFPMRSFSLIDKNLSENKVIGGMFGAQVIGINHNSSVEGNNRVHFRICRYPSISNNIAFSAAAYNNTDSGDYHSSLIYQEALQNIFAALPRDLQKVITPVKKSGRYDTLFILSIKEILGTSTYDTQSEQERYQYLSTSSQNKMYTYNGVAFGTNTGYSYWTRDKVSISSAGTSEMSVNPTLSRCLSPCFTIGKPDTVSASVTLGNTTISLTQFASYIKGGTIQNYLSLGDVIPIKFTDVVFWSGNGGHSCVRAGVYGARVIGFNHNSSVEGNNTVHFQLCMLGNQKISFMGTAINEKGSKTGGYKSATITTDVMRYFYYAMPEAWKKIIDPCKKYTDRGQSGNDSTGNIFSEYFWLPSFTELFGTVSSVTSKLNTVETNKNVQYDLFKSVSDYRYHNYRAYDGDIYTGDMKRKLWTRSTSVTDDQYIAVLVEDCKTLNVSTPDATEILSFTPCFVISGVKATQKVSPPAVTDTELTYNGSSQGPTIANRSNYETYMAFNNDTAVNAGEYTLEISLTNPIYQWASGTEYNEETGCVEIPWTINKAAGSLTLSATTVELTNTVKNKTVTITRSGNGTIKVSNTNPLVATAVLNGTNLQISGLGNGTTTIRVTVEEGSNHSAVTVNNGSKVISVSVNLDTAAGALTWNQISQYSNEGTLSNYIAQYDTKEVTLNGSVGTITFNDAIYKAVCLSPLQNDTLENGTSIKTSHWAILKNSNDKNICFTDNNYSSTSLEVDKFAHNQLSATNNGGWESSDIRRRLREEFIQILPSDLVSNISAIAKYSDNSDAEEENSSNITATYDKLWIPSASELTGSRAYEIAKSPHYAFFSNTFRTSVYRHNSPNSKSMVWTRSRVASYPCNHFWILNHSGSTILLGFSALMSYGIIPCFAIGSNNFIDLTTKVPGQTYEFELGSYKIEPSAVIDSENGALHNMNGVMPITYNEDVKGSTKYSVTIEVMFVSNQGRINQGIFHLCALTNLKGFRFKSQQNYRLGLGDDELVAEKQYSFNTSVFYKIGIKVIDQTVTWTVNDTWSVSAEMNSTFTLQESCPNLFSGFTASNATYVRSISFAIFD